MNAQTARSQGFTLVELTITIVIIALLAGMVLVAGRHAVALSRVSAERGVVVGMKNAVDAFKNDFRFLPPLIDDRLDGAGNEMGALLSAAGQPRVRDDDFLSSATDTDAPRYSVYALSWYIMGALDKPGADNTPLDGAVGPRLTEPLRDGTFKRKGVVHEAFFDPARAGPRHTFGLYPTASGDAARIALTDRWGQPFRYYRWKPQFHPDTGQLEQYLVPRSVGDPADDPELRSAEYAIVSLGPDQRTDAAANGFDLMPRPTGGVVNGAVDDAPLADSVKDNIVEVGR